MTGAIRPHRFGFLLIDDFALMSFAAAVEPLRAANILSGGSLYAWSVVSTGGATARASAGLALAAGSTIADPAAAFDTVMVCAGGNPAAFAHAPTLTWLRRQARAGCALGGVSGGPFVLARAGLLDSHRCTIHWEHFAAFAEAFPHLDITRNVFEIDRARLTCGGGVAALDMMHAIIARDHGAPLAGRVSDWFLQPGIRLGASRQRLPLRERAGIRSWKLAGAIEAIERTPGDPLARSAVAKVAGVSVRQLERLFRRELQTTIDGYRKSARLDQARSMIRQTDLTIVQVGADCGFQNASHFAREYRARFGVAPSKDRSA